MVQLGNYDDSKNWKSSICHTYFDFQFPNTIATFFKLCACLKKMEAILESFKISILKLNMFNLIHQLLKHRASY